MKRYMMILSFCMVPSGMIMSSPEKSHKPATKIAHPTHASKTVHPINTSKQMHSKTETAEQKKLGKKIDAFIQELNKWEYIYDEEEGALKKKVYRILKTLAHKGHGLIHEARGLDYVDTKYYNLLIDALYDLDVQYFKRPPVRNVKPEHPRKPQKKLSSKKNNGHNKNITK